MYEVRIEMWIEPELECARIIRDIREYLETLQGIVLVGDIEVVRTVYLDIGK